MIQKIFIFFLLIIVFASSGCARLKEGVKTLWGSSTRALEEARGEALSQSYFCTIDQCRDQLLKIAAKNEYTVFIDDRKKNLIDLMGIKGSINTTEVGVFFSAVNDHQTRIEIASLSSNAKAIVAKNIFPELEKVFKSNQ